VRLRAALLLALVPSAAWGYDCDYRRVSLRERTTTTTLARGNVRVHATAIVEKGMSGVVQFMEHERGQWVYRIVWDGAMVSNTIVGPDGSRTTYYFPAPSIQEDGVLKSETAEPSIACVEAK
jgi:hypothetical protein